MADYKSKTIMTGEQLDAALLAALDCEANKDQALEAAANAKNYAASAEAAKTEAQQAAADSAEALSGTVADVNQLKSDIDNNLTISWIENASVKYATGEQIPINSYDCTDFIAINPNMSLIVNTAMADDNSGLCFYDKNKNFVSGMNLYDGNRDIHESSIIIPPKVYYVRFPFVKVFGAVRNNAYIKYTNLTTKFTKIAECVEFIDDSYSISAMFSKVLFIGDSLTQGAYYGTPYISKIGKNFPNMFCRMGNIGGNNEGYSGITTSEWYASKKKDTYTNWDLVILWLGTNEGLTDTLNTDVTPYSSYTEYANTNTGCYCKIIESIKESNPSANIVMLSCFASSGNLQTTNTVLEKIATKYDLPLFDTSWLSLANNPDYSYHAGVNNVHLGVFGAWNLAQKLWKFIYDYYMDHWVLLENGVSADINPTNWTYINR